MTRPTRNLIDNAPQLIGRRTLLAGALAAAAASAGCGFGDNGGGSGGGSSDDDGDAPFDGEGGVLRLSMRPVTHIDPAVAGNASFGQILMIGLWEGLVVIDADDPTQVLPGVAESWEVSENGLSYRFHLRPGARWSNGDPVTATDFEWNWRRILTPGIAGEGKPSYNPVEVGISGATEYMNGASDDFSSVGARAVDDATFELALDEPNPDLLLLLAQYWALPLHPATVEEHGDGWFDPENWVSNGAYVLDSFRVNQGAVLLPNEHYWDSDSYHLGRWEVTFNDGGTTADLLSYQSGEIDITGRIQDDLEAVTTSDVANELISSPTNQVRRLNVMSSHHPALQDVRVRQAFAIAIDRAALAELAAPAVAGSSLVPQAVPGYDELPQISFDPDLAQSLLEEAGYPGGRGMPIINLLDFQDSPWVEAIAQMWHENLNVKAQLDIVEQGVYLDKREQVHDENYTGFFINNAAVNPPSLVAFIKRSIPTYPNHVGPDLCPPDIAELVFQARAQGATAEEIASIIDGNRYPELEAALDLSRTALRETDPDIQHDLLVRAATAWDQTYTLIPLLWGGYDLLVKPHIKNFKPWIFSSVFTTKDVYIDE